MKIGEPLIGFQPQWTGSFGLDTKVCAKFRHNWIQIATVRAWGVRSFRPVLIRRISINWFGYRVRTRVRVRDMFSDRARDMVRVKVSVRVISYNNNRALHSIARSLGRMRCLRQFGELKFGEIQLKEPSADTHTYSPPSSHTHTDSAWHDLTRLLLCYMLHQRHTKYSVEW